MSKTPNLFGVLGKPPKNIPTPKVSANLWQMWRRDKVLIERPPEHQVQMKLALCGFSGYAGILWTTSDEGRQECTSLPTPLSPL
jgi:hypothetical protein